MKTFFIKDLKTNDRVKDIFYVSEKRIAVARSGNPYVRLKLEDRTGSILSIKWDINPATFDIREGDFVLIEGVVEDYQGNQQIKINSYKKHTDVYDPADFIPSTDKNIEEMFGELTAIAGSVQDKDLSRLLESFFGNSQFNEQFKNAPAGCSIHHAYVGGLLEHTLSVAKLADKIASHFPQINREILVTGAILHDIGKIEEIGWSKVIEFTDTGHFIGHVAAGAMRVEKAINAIPDFDPELRMQFLHIMLSHHGKREFGAPILPGTREAIALHYIEDLDAKIKMFDEAMQDGGSGKWTKLHKYLERSLYRAPSGKSYSDDLEASANREIEPESFDPFA